MRSSKLSYDRHTDGTAPAEKRQREGHQEEGEQPSRPMAPVDWLVNHSVAAVGCCKGGAYRGL